MILSPIPVVVNGEHQTTSTSLNLSCHHREFVINWTPTHENFHSETGPAVATLRPRLDGSHTNSLAAVAGAAPLAPRYER